MPFGSLKYIQLKHSLVPNAHTKIQSSIELTAIYTTADMREADLPASRSHHGIRLVITRGWNPNTETLLYRLDKKSPDPMQIQHKTHWCPGFKGFNGPCVLHTSWVATMADTKLLHWRTISSKWMYKQSHTCHTMAEVMTMCQEQLTMAPTQKMTLPDLHPQHY